MGDTAEKFLTELGAVLSDEQIDAVLDAREKLWRGTCPEHACKICWNTYGVAVGGNLARSFVRHMKTRHSVTIRAADVTVAREAAAR